MTVATMPSRDAALLYCRRLTRARARNFYYGLKLLPEPQRTALYAVYAWMRRADDIADDAEDIHRARQRLEAFRAATDDALAGIGAPQDPVLVGLMAVAARFPIEGEHLHAMLDGQGDDLEHRRYECFDELRGYCERVASTVGLVCISIWGYSDERARALAVDLGIAFQLTNILRDLREDFDAGRVYVPAEDLRRHGVTIDDVRRGEPAGAVTRLLREQAQRADAFYRRTVDLEALITPSCRPTLWAMRTIYHRLLEKMLGDPLAVVRPQRIRLSSMEKASIVLRARWRARGRGAGG